MTDSPDIVARLREKAQRESEFDRAVGLNSLPKHFPEWEAADEIERLQEIITSAFDELESGDESGCYLILKTAVNALGGQSDG